MIGIIADGGSTKVDWALIDRTKGELLHRFKSDGVNPSIDNSDVLFTKISKAGEEIKQVTAAPLSFIEYYGAGCVSETSMNRLRCALDKIFGAATIIVDSDLTGAAKSVCGIHPGIVCILGTGSNSCYYDGTRIVAHTPALGYILGDEGSGAVLGRNLLTRVFKGAFSADLCGAFHEEFPDIDVPKLIECVYRTPSPNSWLAGFVRFISANISRYSELNELVTEQFRLFIKFNVSHYREYGDYPLNFVGSIASVFHEQLERACRSENFRIGSINNDPLDALIAQYSRH